MPAEHPGPTVVVVRHGETEWSASGRHTGVTDLPLTPAGRAQAEGIGAVLRGRRFATVLTSPLQRAQDTCRLVNIGTAEVVDDLAEWDYGQAEGRTTMDIRREQPGWSVWMHGAPGGESVAQMTHRADRVVDRLLASEGDVLVFAHGHLLRAVTARWLGLPVGEGRRLVLGTAAYGELGWEHDYRALTAWNVAAA